MAPSTNNRDDSQLVNSMMLGSTGGPSSPPQDSSTPALPLSLVPEKALFGHQIRSTVPAQYWGSSITSTSAPDGAVALSISDPSPLPLLTGSGLSRPHLVLATQALKLPGRPSVPGLPSVCEDQGGVVWDRVLGRCGGDSWWALLSGRLRLGRLAGRRADLLAALADPSSYSLGASSRVQLSRHTVLRCRLECSPEASASRLRNLRLCRHTPPHSHPHPRHSRHPRQDGPPTSASATMQQSSSSNPNGLSTGDLSSDSSSSVGSNASAANSTGMNALATSAAVLSPPPPPPPLSLSCQLRSRLGPGTEARADLALGQRSTLGCLAAAATAPWGATWSPQQQDQHTQQQHEQRGGGYGSRGWAQGNMVVATPLLLGLQAGTTAASRAPFVWRCGVLQVTAPPTVPLGGGAAVQGADAAAAAAAAAEEKGPALRSAVYVQGTAAVQGERYLWRGPKKPQRRIGGVADHNPGSAMAAAATATGAQCTAGGADGTAAAGSAPSPPGLGPHNPVRQAASYMLSRIGGGGATRRRNGDDDDDGDGGGGGAGTSGGAPFGVSIPSAGQVHESLIDATQSLSRLRDDVTHATQWVGGGGLAEQLQTGSCGGEGGGEKAGGWFGTQRPGLPSGQQDPKAPPVAPWSSFVGEPHVKVAGVVGLTARTPLILVTHGSSQPSRPASSDDSSSSVAAASSPSASTSLFPMRVEWLQDLGLGRLLQRNRGGDDNGDNHQTHMQNHDNNHLYNAPYNNIATNHVSDYDAPSSAGPRVSAATGPIIPQLGAVRPFASAGVSVQAGRFSSWVLDFTRLAAQLDAGLWGPRTAVPPSPGPASSSAASASAAPRRLRHPAFALGDTGAWHCVSLSLSQQLLGPLRLAADWRFRLASNSPLATQQLLRTPKATAAAAPAAGAAEGGGSGGSASSAVRGLACHVGGMRGQLVEAVYALDLAVPGSAGAARLVAWYSPQRREGMLELRVF